MTLHDVRKKALLMVPNECAVEVRFCEGKTFPPFGIYISAYGRQLAHQEAQTPDEVWEQIQKNENFISIPERCTQFAAQGA
jgi:hypothetical protein